MGGHGSPRFLNAGSRPPPAPMAEAWRLEEDEEELRELGRRHRRVALSSAAGEGRGRGGPRRRLLLRASPGPLPGSEFLSGARRRWRCCPKVRRPSRLRPGSGQFSSGASEPRAGVSPERAAGRLSGPRLSPRARSFSELMLTWTRTVRHRHIQALKMPYQETKYRFF